MASFTEREGVHYCGLIAERNKWMFREQPVDDVGIDAHMEYMMVVLITDNPFEN